jgi:hypothetical protein
MCHICHPLGIVIDHSPPGKNEEEEAAEQDA